MGNLSKDQSCLTVFAGMDEHIAKPLDREQLIEIVARLAREKKLAMEL